MPQCICMSTLQEMIIDETEIESLTEGFEKRSGQLSKSYFTSYTRHEVSVLKPILSGREVSS